MFVYLIILIILFFVSLVTGYIPVYELSRKIFLDIRLSTSIIALFTGINLSVGGVVFQILTRNPLAEPYILGISNGAALGVVVFLVSGIDVFWGKAIFAFLGAILILLVIGALAKGNGFSSFGIIIYGIIVNMFLGGILLFFVRVLAPQKLLELSSWMIGFIPIVRLEYSVLFSLISVIIVFFVFILYKKLDLLAMGDEIAITTGISPIFWRGLFAVLISLLVAINTAITGPIGFVGLVVPHIGRAIAGSIGKRLLVISSIFGGILLLISFILSKILISGYTVPIGIFTSIIGVPYLLFLIRRKGYGRE